MTSWTKTEGKNNLVVHNLSEDNEGSREDRAAQDVGLFQEVVKEVFRMNIILLLPNPSEWVNECPTGTGS